MPVIAVNRVVSTREPRLLVENDLPVGRYRFRLTVVDGDRNESAPAELVVSIVKPTRPGRFDDLIAQPIRDLRTILRGGAIPLQPIKRDPPNG